MLHELENNEAILLMYIAGELPEEERREVEQMLAKDSGLRATHDELRASWASAMSAVETLDHADAPPMNAEVAARQVGRLVRQWHAGMVPHASEPSDASVSTGRRVAWWQTTAAAAAVMFLGFLVYWGWTDAPGQVNAGTEVAQTAPSGDGDIRPSPGLAIDSRSRGFGDGKYNPDVPDDSGKINIPYFDPTGIDPNGVASAGTADLDRQVEALKLLQSSAQ